MPANIFRSILRQVGQLVKRSLTSPTISIAWITLTYRNNGYQIGSGTIESACKQIVTQRLKVSGAIWELDNAVKTAKARSAWLNGDWQTLSSRREFSALPLAA